MTMIITKTRKNKMINVSIRYYTKNGDFVDSFNIPGVHYGMVKEALKTMMEPFEKYHCVMDPHWCNVMIRRNGKLISYKEFM